MDAVGLADRIGEVFPRRPKPARFRSSRRLNASPRTTSLGRRFDAVTAVLGFVTVQQDEAWAAMRLEAEAQKAADAMGLADFGAFPYWPDAWQIHADGVLDMTTLDRRLVEGRLAGEDPAKLALLWQTTLTHALADWAVKLCGNDPAGAHIVLSGGCVVNRTLADGLPPPHAPSRDRRGASAPCAARRRRRRLGAGVDRPPGARPRPHRL